MDSNDDEEDGLQSVRRRRRGHIASGEVPKYYTERNACLWVAEMARRPRPVPPEVPHVHRHRVVPIERVPLLGVEEADGDDREEHARTRRRTEAQGDRRGREVGAVDRDADKIRDLWVAEHEADEAHDWVGEEERVADAAGPHRRRQLERDMVGDAELLLATDQADTE